MNRHAFAQAAKPAVARIGATAAALALFAFHAQAQSPEWPGRSSDAGVDCRQDLGRITCTVSFPLLMQDGTTVEFCLKSQDPNARQACFTGRSVDVGTPTDPAVFQEQQKRLQDELNRRAEAARRKLQDWAR